MKGRGESRPVTVFRSFQIIPRHFPLDDPRLDPIAAFRELRLGDSMEEFLMQAGEVGRIHEDPKRQDVPDGSPSRRETESIVVDLRFEGSLMHQRPDEKMSDQQSIEFLNHAHGFLAPQRSARESLMGVELINDPSSSQRS